MSAFGFDMAWFGFALWRQMGWRKTISFQRYDGMLISKVYRWSLFVGPIEIRKWA